jgi:hypothetical protein
VQEAKKEPAKREPKHNAKHREPDFIIHSEEKQVTEHNRKDLR